MAKARPDLKRKMEKFSAAQNRANSIVQTVGVAHSGRRAFRSAGPARPHWVAGHCGLGTCGPAGTGVVGAFGLGLAAGAWLVAGVSRIEDSLRP